MPIIDYEKAARTAERTFFERSDISDVNKAAMRRYLLQYNVRAATKAKFLRHIVFLLKELPDIEKQMNDRDAVNAAFKKFRTTLKPGYLATLINVSKSFVRWLNDKEKPKGFRDVEQISKKDQRTQRLHPEDMWLWEDLEKFCLITSATVQIQAIMATQLDCGMRPSEFVDLNYGDVAVDNDVVIFQIQEGKTGRRPCQATRCTALFLRWYNNHPTKNRNDPLWVLEHADKSHGKKENKSCRYSYKAILKRLENIILKAEIKKPFDFYTLRHSSCVLDKLDNLPIDLAAGRHGHSVVYYDEVYGRVDLKGLAKRHRAHYLSSVESEKKLGITCERCKSINPSGKDVCFQCASPLNVKKALESYVHQQEEMAKMKEQLKRFSQILSSSMRKGSLDEDAVEKYLEGK